MHTAFNSLVAAVAIACAALAATARGDMVYVVSYSTGGLFRFDTSNPETTMTIVSGTGTFFGPTALAFGPDGDLYIGESGDGSVARISRYVLSSGSISPVIDLLSGTGAAFASGPVYPAAIAFKSAAQGGQMLVGRNPFFGVPGPVVAVTNWLGGTASASAYTTGTVSMAGSAGLAVAADGSLYASNAVYAGPGLAIAGTVERFDAAGEFVETVAPGVGFSGGAFGPGGLLLSGSTLYSASIEDGTIYATNLTTGTTSPFGVTGFPYQVGPLARLSSGDFMAGSVSGGGNIYVFSEAGALAGPPINYMETQDISYFGQIGGLAIAPVPEPSTVALLGLGTICIAARGFRRRSDPAR